MVYNLLGMTQEIFVMNIQKVLGLITLALLLSASTVTHAQSWHSADTSPNGPDGQIGLSELLRVIQFFHHEELHCDESSEDGYGAGPGNTTSCKNHSSDYDPTNMSIGLKELLRAVQLYNAGDYLVAASGEDGYIPVRNSKGALFDIIATHDGTGPSAGYPGYDPNMHPLCAAKDVAFWGSYVVVVSTCYNEVIVLDATTLPTPNSLPLVRVLQTGVLPSGGQGLHPVDVTVVGDEAIVLFKKTVNTGYTEGAVGVFNLNNGTAVASVESPLLMDAQDASVVGNDIFVVSFNDTLTKITRSGSTLTIVDSVTDPVLLSGAVGIDVEGGVAYVVGRNSRALVGYNTSNLSLVGFYQDTANNLNQDAFTIFQPRNVVVENGYAYVSALTFIRTEGVVTTTYGYDVAVFDTSTFAFEDGIKLLPWDTTSPGVPGLAVNLDVQSGALIVSNPDGVYEVDISGVSTLGSVTLGDNLAGSIDGKLKFAPNGDLYVLNQQFLHILRRP